MVRKSCASCDGELTRFLDLGATPLANTLPGSAVAEETWYPLEVAVCTACWLVQLLEIVPDEEIYGASYSFRTGASPQAAGYFSAVADDLMSRFGGQAKRLTVEIACNDGTLLQRFADAGCATLGIEPSGATVDAVERGLDVLRTPFTSELAKMYGESTAGLIVAFNVMAHVPDPRDFLDGVRVMLARDGVAAIEFQDFAALAAGCQFDHVYHEHRFFYSLASFSRMAARCGLELFDFDRSLVQGGSIRAYLRRGTYQSTVAAVVTDPWLEHAGVYKAMQGRAEFARERIRSLVSLELDEGRVIAGYGATAKACTLLNFCDLGPSQVRWVGDTTAGKIGRFVPGTGIPIQAFGEDRPPDTYLLTAWSYFSSVVRREAEFLRGGGKFILPGAVPVIL
jgi:SAM-dependent methyltransferase